VQSPAVVAMGSGVCSAFHISGSEVTVDGDVRSNGDVAFYVSEAEVDGVVAYGGSLLPGSHQLGGHTVHQPGAGDVTLPYTIDEIVNGDVFPDVERIVHNGKLQIHNSIEPGIHIVHGDVGVSGNEIDLNGVTIVATGRINLSSSSITLTPAAAGLPTLMTSASDCNRAAIQISGSDTVWHGPVVAADGLIRMSGAELHGNAPIYGGAIRISGSEIRLANRPAAAAASADETAVRTNPSKHDASLSPVAPAAPDAVETARPGPMEQAPITATIGRSGLAHIIRSITARCGRPFGTLLR
jgi:hypothetical protein